MRCAAAANPTGPPPITATGRDSRLDGCIFSPSGTIEIMTKKRRPRRPPPHGSWRNQHRRSIHRPETQRGYPLRDSWRGRSGLSHDAPASPTPFGSTGADGGRASRRQSAVSPASGRPAALHHLPEPAPYTPVGASGFLALRVVWPLFRV